jgi:hypothetical protein
MTNIEQQSTQVMDLSETAPLTTIAVDDHENDNDDDIDVKSSVTSSETMMINDDTVDVYHHDESESRSARTIMHIDDAQQNRM